MGEIFYLLEDCATITNIVLLVGLLCLLRIAVSLTGSLWSGTKAFVLSCLFRVKLNSSYGWAGKYLITSFARNDTRRTELLTSTDLATHDTLH